MADETAKTCRLRYALRIENSKRITYLCRARHGFMVKHWKCVGRNHENCPLVIAAEQGVEPTVTGRAGLPVTYSEWLRSLPA